ncbi:MAG: PRTRC system ThiF family protein [Cytophagaceae bacterium]|jgi:PRTRC genetic system ThiF family protein
MKPAKHFLWEYLWEPQHPIYISVIGAGGTGSQMITQLARINHSLKALGHPGLFVIAYDPDLVTEANLGRQLFSPADLGRNKATVLIERVNRFFGTEWDSQERKFSMEDKPGNIIITCVDNVETRKQIGKLQPVSGGIYTFRYWMDIGNTRTKGQVILGTIGSIKQPKSEIFTPVSKLKTVTGMFKKLEQFDTDDQGPSCSVAEALRKQDLFINSMLVQYAGNILWKLLTDFSLTYQGVYVNLETLSANPIKINPIKK